MLDINFIRANRQKVEDAIRNKAYEIDLDEILKLDDSRKELSREIDALRQERNQISAQMKGGKPAPEKTTFRLASLKTTTKSLRSVARFLISRIRRIMPRLPMLVAGSTRSALRRSLVLALLILRATW